MSVRNFVNMSARSSLAGEGSSSSSATFSDVGIDASTLSTIAKLRYSANVLRCSACIREDEDDDDDDDNDDDDDDDDDNDDDNDDDDDDDNDGALDESDGGQDDDNGDDVEDDKDGGGVDDNDNDNGGVEVAWLSVTPHSVRQQTRS